MHSGPGRLEGSEVADLESDSTWQAAAVVKIAEAVPSCGSLQCTCNSSKNQASGRGWDCHHAAPPAWGTGV